MADAPPGLLVTSVRARDTRVVELIDALTAELARAEYTADQTFGYSVDQLESSGVHLVGASLAGRLVGIGGLEPQPDGVGELKRFYVAPGHRGAGVADAVLDALVARAVETGLSHLQLETGDRQQAAVAFYRRHGFVEVPRFGAYVDSATSVCMRRDLAASP